MAVGDVNSTEKGSGARYNDGKAPLDLIPAWILAHFDTERRDRLDARELIELLGAWQAGQISALDIISQVGYSDMLEAARVFGYGAKKYAAWNWIRGMQWSVPLGCALRHAFAEMYDTDVDSESGFTHRGHLVCNLVMLAQFERTFPEGDDRPVQWLSPTGVEVVRTGGSACLADFESALAAEMSKRRKRGSPIETMKVPPHPHTPWDGRSTDTCKTLAR